MSFLKQFRHGWTPAQLSMELWLDAADASTITESGGSVSQWDDKSGNNNHATQSSSSLQPAFSTTNFNGLPGMDFASDKMLTSYTPTLAGDYHAFAVVIPHSTSTATNNNRVIGTLENTSPYAGVCLQAQTTRAHAFHRKTSNIVATATGTLTGGSIISTYREVDDIYVDIDGGVATATTAVAAGGINSGPMAIGSERTDSSSYYDGIAAEIIFIDASIDDATRQKVEGYLAWKWGLVANLPAAHPYKDAPPYA